MARTRLATRSDGASPAPRLVARAIEKKKKEEKKKKNIEGAKAKEMRRTEKEAKIAAKEAKTMEKKKKKEEEIKRKKAKREAPREILRIIRKSLRSS